MNFISKSQRSQKQTQKDQLQLLKHPQKRKPLLILWGRKPTLPKEKTEIQGRETVKGEGSRFQSSRQSLLSSYMVASLF